MFASLAGSAPRVPALFVTQVRSQQDTEQVKTLETYRKRQKYPGGLTSLSRYNTAGSTAAGGEQSAGVSRRLSGEKRLKHPAGVSAAAAFSV